MQISTAKRTDSGTDVINHWNGELASCISTLRQHYTGKFYGKEILEIIFCLNFFPRLFPEIILQNEKTDQIEICTSDRSAIASILAEVSRQHALMILDFQL